MPTAFFILCSVCRKPMTLERRDEKTGEAKMMCPVGHQARYCGVYFRRFGIITTQSGVLRKVPSNCLGCGIPANDKYTDSNCLECKMCSTVIVFNQETRVWEKQE